MKVISIAVFLAALTATMAAAATLNPVETETKVLVDLPSDETPIAPQTGTETASTNLDDGDKNLSGTAIQHPDGTSSITYTANLTSGGDKVKTYLQTQASFDYVADGYFDFLFNQTFDFQVSNTSIYIEGWDVKVDLSYVILVNGALAYDAYYSVETYVIENAGQGLTVTNQDGFNAGVTAQVQDGWTYGHTINFGNLTGSVALPALGYNESARIDVRMGVFVEQPQTEKYVQVTMGDPNGVAPTLGVSDPVSAVPLPAGAWLLLGGLGALGLMRRRRG